MVSCLSTLLIWRSKHAMHWMLYLSRLSMHRCLSLLHNTLYRVLWGMKTTLLCIKLPLAPAKREGYLSRIQSSSGIWNVLLKTERIHVCASNSTASILDEPCIFAFICINSVNMKTSSSIRNVLLKTERKLVFVKTVDTRFIQCSKCSTQNRQNDVDTVDTCYMQQDKEPS